MRTLAPVVAAQGNTGVVETDPGTCDQAGMNQDEPAVGIILRRAGFSGDVGAQAELAAHRCSGALVYGAAQHIDQISDGLVG